MSNTTLRPALAGRFDRRVKPPVEGEMNCKQGNMAVVVRSMAGNDGKIVRCLRVVVYGAGLGYGPRWVTEPVLRGCFGEPQAPLDACLRALRDSDGEDEILRIAGRPVGTPQAA